ncbi:hypothetical protein M9Y10_041269 [Tritrichomonas musculus]|uniref:Uncharacterized protein n=1 Tax=Tritrichomonas musculus TaxID=1915356 RepID=A0ABR2K6Y7_9EUKA
MSSCFILPPNFDRESLLLSLSHSFKANPNNGVANTPVFNLKSPSLYSEEFSNPKLYANDQNNETYFVTFSTKSARLQKDSIDQINKIKSDWDALIKMKEESMNLSPDVEVRIKYDRGQSAWNKNKNRINRDKSNKKVENLDKENKKESKPLEEPTVEEEEVERPEIEATPPQHDQEGTSDVEINSDDDDDIEGYATTSCIQNDPFSFSMRKLLQSRRINDDDSDYDIVE